MRFCPPPSAAAARRRSISVILADMRLSTKFEDIALPVRARQFKCEFAKLQSPFLQIRLPPMVRSEEHTSELQSLMRISYAVFCLKKKKTIKRKTKKRNKTT